MHFLIIEDEEADFIMLKRLLKQMDFKGDLSFTRASYMGEIAEVTKNNKNSIDLIFLDLMLPDISDVEGVDQIRENFSDVPLIVLTGNTQKGRDLESIGHGADDFLFKENLNYENLRKAIYYTFERFKLIKTLRQAKLDAEHANHIKSNFLSNMSHEIRTPLNLITGTADLLSETSLNKNQRKYVNTFIKSSKHLLSLINEILDYSKIEADGVKTPLKELFSIENLFTDVSQLVEAQFATGAVSFECTLREKPSFIYEGDRRKIYQILLNCINNSYKFTQQGYVRLSAEVNKSKDKLLKSVKFKIEDTGHGIPKDKIDQIFESFYQVESTMVKSFQGTGLGLAIVKKQVLSLGGLIKVSSQENLGTSIEITIPLKIYKEAIAAVNFTEKNLTNKSNTSLTSTLKNKECLNLLIVDDDLDNRELIKAYLLSSPHNYDFAVNGLVAIEKFKKYNYDLILMDLQMPKMDGYSAVEKIRAIEKTNKKKKTQIFALSANAIKKDIDRAEETEFSSYITKPVRKNDLLKIIDESQKSRGFKVFNTL